MAEAGRGAGCSAISARLGHAAALLDGELPPEIADDAASAGLDLLPGGGVRIHPAERVVATVPSAWLSRLTWWLDIVVYGKWVLYRSANG